MKIFASSATGLTLYATIMRMSDGYYWNPTAVAFQSAPVFVDKRIALTEQSSENAGTYYVEATGLGDAGEVLVRIHDAGDSNKTVSLYRSYVEGGEEAKSHKIADHVLRRTFGNARTAPHGDTVSARSLLGVEARFVNKWEVVDNELIVYQEDDSTVFVTIPLVPDAGADPIVSMDPPS